MAIAKIAKIQIIGTSSNKDTILDILQNSGKVEIHDITEEKEDLMNKIFMMWILEHKQLNCTVKQAFHRRAQK